MIRNSKHIEIVRSEVKGLSSMSQESCDSILAVLTKHFVHVGVTVINSLADLDALVASCPDLVFLGMEFITADPDLGIDDPDKIWLSEVFDSHDILYTGSSRSAHELQRNKHLAKRRVMEAGLQTSAFWVINQSQPLDMKDIPLDFPLFVKPTNRGGGLGIDSDSVVHSFEQLQSKSHSIITKFRSDVLVEEYLEGREFSVAILKDEYSAELIAMPIELVAPADKNGSRLLSSQIKSSNAEQALEVTDLSLRFKITALALAVFDALGARDYGRIDIRLDKDGMPHFLEANLIPSLISGYGSFPKACMLNIGLEYEGMIMNITNLALARSKDALDVPEPITITEPILLTTNIAFEPI